MNITILMGSPNRNGSTSMLVHEFIKGAEEAGHSCEVIDVCHANIHPCTGCVACGYEGPCSQKDDVEDIRFYQTYQDGNGSQYTFKDCGGEISDIFESFNIALERISCYGRMVQER